MAQLANAEEDTSWLGNLIHDARQALKSFCSWKISHTRTKGNMALAALQLARNLKVCNWIEEHRSFLHAQLIPMYLVQKKKTKLQPVTLPHPLPLSPSLYKLTKV